MHCEPNCPSSRRLYAVLIHLTDHCEESLVEIITSLDTQLFERLSGPIHEDFQKPTALGVFHLTHLCEAISQFRLLKRASLAALELAAATPASSAV